MVATHQDCEGVQRGRACHARSKVQADTRGWFGLPIHGRKSSRTFLRKRSRSSAGWPRSGLRCGPVGRGNRLTSRGPVRRVQEGVRVVKGDDKSDGQEVPLQRHATPIQCRSRKGYGEVWWHGCRQDLPQTEAPGASPARQSERTTRRCSKDPATIESAIIAVGLW